MSNKKWTKDEIEILEQLYKDRKPIKEIANVLGRTYSATQTKITDLKLSKKYERKDRVDKIIGMKFGRLTVIEKQEGWVGHGHAKKFKCICDCQLSKPEDERQYVYVSKGNLVSGDVRSCGCLWREIICCKGKNKKYNIYDLESFDYGVGWTLNGETKFLFDKEDYDLIKVYCWHSQKGGYLRTTKTSTEDDTGKNSDKQILMHTLIMNAHGLNRTNEIDHINGNPSDNRKQNLRSVTHSQNMKNVRTKKSNTSGRTGVYWYKLEKKWKVRIYVNGKAINLGTFKNFDDAVTVREEAEEKYFGEYARERDSA